MITLSEPARYNFHHCPGQQQQDIGATGPAAQGKGADSDSGDRSEERESTQKAAGPQYTAGQQARHGPGMQTEGQLQDCGAFAHVGSGCLLCKD